MEAFAQYVQHNKHGDVRDWRQKRVGYDIWKAPVHNSTYLKTADTISNTNPNPSGTSSEGEQKKDAAPMFFRFFFCLRWRCKSLDGTLAQEWDRILPRVVMPVSKFYRAQGRGANLSCLKRRFYDRRARFMRKVTNEHMLTTVCFLEI